MKSGSILRTIRTRQAPTSKVLSSIGTTNPFSPFSSRHKPPCAQSPLVITVHPAVGRLGESRSDSLAASHSSAFTIPLFGQPAFADLGEIGFPCPLNIFFTPSLARFTIVDSHHHALDIATTRGKSYLSSRPFGGNATVPTLSIPGQSSRLLSTLDTNRFCLRVALLQTFRP